jgi:glycerophosphoryl diester phosphodiesterase
MLNIVASHSKENDVSFPTPCLIGHRGLAALAPENSLQGIALAREKGFSWVEVDVQFSSDGEPFLFHDRTSSSMGGPRKAMVDMPWQTISNLELLDPRTRTAFRVPHLEQVLDLIGQTGLSVNLELKYHKPVEPRRLQSQWLQLSRLAQARHLPAQRILYSSFSPSFESVACHRDSSMKVGLLATVRDMPETIANKSRILKPDSLHIPLRMASKKRLAPLLSLDLPVFVYTVNDSAQLATLLAQGVRGVFTDCLVPSRPQGKTEP